MIDKENYYNSILSTPIDTIYLKHHGVEGMKWGEQNGPPYPLSGEGKKNFIQQRKEVRLEKRKNKILKDPKKVIKNSHLFSKEEIDAANDKFESLNKTKRLSSTVTLSKAKSRMARDPMTLEKNINRFTPEELDLAISQLERRNKIWDKKLEEIKKPHKTMKVVEDYLSTTVSMVKNVLSGAQAISGLNDMRIKKTGHGLTLEDQYEVYKKKHNPDKDIFNKKVNKQQVTEFLEELSKDDLEKLLKEIKPSKNG